MRRLARKAARVPVEIVAEQRERAAQESNGSIGEATGATTLDVSTPAHELRDAVASAFFFFSR